MFSKFPPMRYTCSLLILPAVMLSAVASANTDGGSYPMTDRLWQGEKAAFTRSEVFPDGLMTVAEGLSILKKNIDFADGTIDFDMKPLAYADTGIQFHRRDANTAEFVYVRADPDCPAANDCVQYAPITNGRMQWNTYSQYQNGAPIADRGWNHLHLVIADGRMRLFVNHALEPSLDVSRLRGLADRGGLAVKGPAIFANMVVQPGVTGNAPPAVGSTPRKVGTVGRILLGPVTSKPIASSLAAADIPTRGWHPIPVEPDGLINLARAIPPNATTTPETAWLKVTINASTSGDRVLQLGFVPRAWLFLDGSPIYVGENFYYPDDKRLAPAGRFAPDNAKVTMHLAKGRHALVLALDDAWRVSNGSLKVSHYGWAASLRFENPSGLEIQ